MEHFLELSHLKGIMNTMYGLVCTKVGAIETAQLPDLNGGYPDNLSNEHSFFQPLRCIYS